MNQVRVVADGSLLEWMMHTPARSVCVHISEDERREHEKVCTRRAEETETEGR